MFFSIFPLFSVLCMCVCYVCTCTYDVMVAMNSHLNELYCALHMSYHGNERVINHLKRENIQYVWTHQTDMVQ